MPPKQKKTGIHGFGSGNQGARTLGQAGVQKAIKKQKQQAKRGIGRTLSGMVVKSYNKDRKQNQAGNTRKSLIQDVVDLLDKYYVPPVYFEDSEADANDFETDMEAEESDVSEEWDPKKELTSEEAGAEELKPDRGGKFELIPNVNGDIEAIDDDGVICGDEEKKSSFECEKNLIDGGEGRMLVRPIMSKSRKQVMQSKLEAAKDVKDKAE